MDVLIGCPVSKREWILDRWKHHVDVACHNAGITPRFTFVAAPDDVKSIDIVSGWWDSDITYSDEEPREDERDWPSTRLHKMVGLRNLLLGKVRETSPDLFLSLDSDILLHPNAIVGMLDVLRDKSAVAVGGKTYMTRSGVNYPSYGSTYNLRRSECVSVLRVSVIMAIVLMTPAAYNIDYEFHPYGEDIGWSKAIGSSGGQLWWDGRVTSKHVMTREMLEKVDDRCGF